ncbi:MAG: histidine kinase [Candidatus Syntrophoarchaeum caldarius]|uniref:Histidine kinase n=1 Tax=Candidatus Syntropharchaeum caldarium TaxID=1838285 RepID=A0A1F2P949_9EURY|nr:MAG: histidine kinase [Candidatus Syntrophoarchaeum caldarius]
MIDTKLAVKNVMIKDVVVVQTDATVREAAELMNERDVDSVIVLDSKKPVGIVTYGDIVRKVLLKDRDAKKTTIKEIMTSPLTYADPEDDINAVLRTMYRHGIRKLPVLKDGDLVGIIADIDINTTYMGMGTILTDLVEMNSDTAFLHCGLPEEGDDASMRQGICEVCGAFSSNLVVEGGVMLCENCRESY